MGHCIASVMEAAHEGRSRLIVGLSLCARGPELYYRRCSRLRHVASIRRKVPRIAKIRERSGPATKIRRSSYVSLPMYHSTPT